SPAQTIRSRYRRKKLPCHCSRSWAREAIGTAMYTNAKEETAAAGNGEESSSRLIAIMRKRNGAKAAAESAIRVNAELESSGVWPGLIAKTRKNKPVKTYVGVWSGRMP